MASTDTITVCILSSTRYGHVEAGYNSGVWAVPKTDIGGLHLRADRLTAGMPCLFYVSANRIWGDGFFCGPGLILKKPTDEFATEHSDLFSEERDWCLGFPIERLANSVSTRMEADAIRLLQVVRDGRGNYSQDLHLAGRSVFLPCIFPADDCRAILAATCAFPNALERWRLGVRVGGVG